MSRSPSRLLGGLRPVLSVIAALSVALILYGAAYNHLRPRNPHPDPLLAARLIPLELLLGVLVGGLVYRSFGARLRQDPRPEAQERMVTRLALRRGGRFTLAQLTEASPLSEPQAREVTARMLEAGRLKREGHEYTL